MSGQLESWKPTCISRGEKILHLKTIKLAFGRGYQRQTGGTGGGTKPDFKDVNLAFMRVSRHHSIDPSPNPCLKAAKNNHLAAFFVRSRYRPALRLSSGMMNELSCHCALKPLDARPK